MVKTVVPQSGISLDYLDRCAQKAAVLPAGGGSAFGGKTDYEQMHWVYVLRSKKDKKLYIGSTADLDKRLRAHNNGRVRSTKSRKPFELVLKEEYFDVTSARKRENLLKSGWGRKWLKEVL